VRNNCPSVSPDSVNSHITRNDVDVKYACHAGLYIATTPTTMSSRLTVPPPISPVMTASML